MVILLLLLLVGCYLVLCERPVYTSFRQRGFVASVSIRERTTVRTAIVDAIVANYQGY